MPVCIHASYTEWSGEDKSIKRESYWRFLIFSMINREIKEIEGFFFFSWSIACIYNVFYFLRLTSGSLTCRRFFSSLSFSSLSTSKYESCWLRLLAQWSSAYLIVVMRLCFPSSLSLKLKSIICKLNYFLSSGSLLRTYC